MLVKLVPLIGLLLTLYAAPLIAFDLERVKPNLHPNPTIPSATGWVGSGATFDGAVTRTAGTGSLKILGGVGQLAFGPAIPITVGKTYTCSVYFMGNTSPSDFMRLSMNLTNSAGTSLGQGIPASDWGYVTPGVWQEAVVFHTAVTGEAFMKILVSRDAPYVGTNPIWFDDVYCGEDVSFAEAPTPKVSFNGGLVKVASDGTVSLLRSDGTFRPEFLRCMFKQNGDDYSKYAPNGWNCNMWSVNAADMKTTSDAGLPYAFFQLSAYTEEANPLFGNITQLAADINGILNSSYATNLVGYYLDNESQNNLGVQVQVLNKVIELDTKAGKRQRPIYILQGNPGSALAYGAYANMTGSYQIMGTPIDPLLLILQHIVNQKAPVVFGQIQYNVPSSGKSAATMQAQVTNILNAGGSAIGYFHPPSTPITAEAWYSSMPSIIEDALTTLVADEMVCRP